ncbi:MAG: hypothetical protein H7A24_08765 [Leptospiraceae bacterium]|nr:hypothetical protein [Leptospiraceae bacterium]MCP5511959.1 hypothetical protein [Leptospiraceae bacterium]
MKIKIIVSILFSFSLMIELEAKCFQFSNTDTIRVCVDGNSKHQRKKAQEICKKKFGNLCGRIVGTSNYCTKNSNTRCFDQKGKEKDRVAIE